MDEVGTVQRLEVTALSGCGVVTRVPSHGYRYSQYSVVHSS